MVPKTESVLKHSRSKKSKKDDASIDGASNNATRMIEGNLWKTKNTTWIAIP
jgi:hypothetical protein